MLEACETAGRAPEGTLRTLCRSSVCGVFRALPNLMGRRLPVTNSAPSRVGDKDQCREHARQPQIAPGGAARPAPAAPNARRRVESTATCRQVVRSERRNRRRTTSRESRSVGRSSICSRRGLAILEDDGESRASPIVRGRLIQWPRQVGRLGEHAWIEDAKGSRRTRAQGHLGIAEPSSAMRLNCGRWRTRCADLWMRPSTSTWYSG